MERRKDKRFPFEITLNIEELYKQDYVKIEDLNEEFQVTNISKSGLGFACKHELPLDFYFNAKITIDDEKFFFTVLKIIRINEEEEGYNYGCEFVGLADILSSTIEGLEE
ncbi:PilZ domain-containing protein [Acidaminobacter sp. JC074]|uniref:PilZ domain-containing protein n=1 Tax=Acidaminobacter sp. JC074 TaxID=2530199 RepID=UPI001F11723A|nr:PilZ domain-containing protein [Acidaminobacter sp. JC074]